jgi:hypothetical protein
MMVKAEAKQEALEDAKHSSHPHSRTLKFIKRLTHQEPLEKLLGLKTTSNTSKNSWQPMKKPLFSPE